MELVFGGQLGISGNPDDDRVAVRRGVRGRLGGLDFFELQIALLRVLRGGQSRQRQSGNEKAK
ncbi:MAG: hypothetical protein ACLQVL_32680, partial [Terriglobia bacterium]